MSATEPLPQVSAPAGGWVRRVSLIVSLTAALVEVGARLETGAGFSLTSPDDRTRFRDLDPVVGFVPKADVWVRPRKGHFTISTGPHGVRRNGPTPARTERPRWLVTGDSFAFGDDVDDAQSWPAVLESTGTRRVFNAAVPGFGLDQAVLRAEALQPVFEPDWLLVGFIPHDVLRCEMRWWSGNPKPHFDIQDEVLVYRPAPRLEGSTWLSSIKRVIASSVALDLAFQRWLHSDHADEPVHDRGVDVACLLMDRLARLRDGKALRVAVVAQPQRAVSHPEERAIKDEVLACARERGLVSIDVFPVVDALPAEARAPLFAGHMTAAGNRLVAAHVAASLPP